MRQRSIRSLRAERRAGVAKYFRWKEAEQLKKIAMEIQDLRAEFGQPNAQIERFLYYCSLRGSKVPGEPKLAKAFLDEILRGPSAARAGVQPNEAVAARLLPSERWSECLRCGVNIPEFEFSESFRSQLRDLIQRNARIEILKKLREESGCEFAVAKSWVAHKTYEQLQTAPRKVVCPHCGDPLRTSRAKQCRFCHRDWH